MYLFIVQRSLMPRNAMLHYAAKEGREELRAALSDMPLSPFEHSFCANWERGGDGRRETWTAVHEITSVGRRGADVVVKAKSTVRPTPARARGPARCVATLSIRRLITRSDE